MNIQIIGRKNDPLTRKAERFFKERGIAPHFVDLAERPLRQGELENIAAALSVDALLDREGGRFSKRGLAFMEFDPFEELLADQLLLRIPIVRNGKRATVGRAEEEWRGWIDADKRGSNG